MCFIGFERGLDRCQLSRTGTRAKSNTALYTRMRLSLTGTRAEVWCLLTYTRVSVSFTGPGQTPLGGGASVDTQKRLSHTCRGRGESLVPPHTRGSVSLSQGSGRKPGATLDTRKRISRSLFQGQIQPGQTPVDGRAALDTPKRLHHRPVPGEDQGMPSGGAEVGGSNRGGGGRRGGGRGVCYLCHTGRRWWAGWVYAHLEKDDVVSGIQEVRGGPLPRVGPGMCCSPRHMVIFYL